MSWRTGEPVGPAVRGDIRGGDWGNCEESNPEVEAVVGGRGCFGGIGGGEGVEGAVVVVFVVVGSGGG